MNNSFKEKTLYVEGMHCASCELIIEKKLLKKVGVESVDASLKNAEVRVVTQDSTHLNPDELNKDFGQLGYRFSRHPIGNRLAPLWHRDVSGRLKLNKVRFQKILKNSLLAGLLLLAFFVVERAQLGRFVSVEPGATLGVFFMLGLIAGISSCAALIGGLLLTLTKHWHEQRIEATGAFERGQPHMLFHAGRLIAFFGLGGVLGLLGSGITFRNTTMYAVLVIAISLVMLSVALQMLNVDWAKKFSFRLPRLITRAAAKDTAGKGSLAPFMAGGLTFFLPCGFTLIAQGVALASGSFIGGGLVMLYFAFGTLPMLVGISFSGVAFTRKPHLTARFSAVAGILILFFALYNLNGQFNVLGLPSLSDVPIFRSTLPTVAATQSSSPQTGEQILSLVAKEFSYIPVGSTTIKSGIPTKLIVDDQGILGCGAFIAARGLIDGFIPLNRGQNVIDLGAPQPGTYKITCSMGMVAPVTINVL